MRKRQSSSSSPMARWPLSQPMTTTTHRLRIKPRAGSLVALTAMIALSQPLPITCCKRLSSFLSAFWKLKTSKLSSLAKSSSLSLIFWREKAPNLQTLLLAQKIQSSVRIAQDIWI
ncbi:hypothetical protein TB1_030889 [Malus domestica]